MPMSATFRICCCTPRRWHEGRLSADSSSIVASAIMLDRQFLVASMAGAGLSPADFQQTTLALAAAGATQLIYAVLSKSAADAVVGHDIMATR